MNPNHLHILHVGSNTPSDKVNHVAGVRLEKLIIELREQGIEDYTIVEGFFDLKNTKKAIHQGHQLIIRLAKEQNMPYVIIAEDDLVFTAKGAWKYFLSQIPKSFDLFFGVIYDGEIKDNRVINGFSAGMTLYIVHSRFYDFMLEQPVNSHIDRNAGGYAHLYEYYIVSPQIAFQRGGFSTNLKKILYYDPYMSGKSFYGRENQEYSKGSWKAKSN